MTSMRASWWAESKPSDDRGPGGDGEATRSRVRLHAPPSSYEIRLHGYSDTRGDHGVEGGVGRGFGSAR